MIMKSVASSFFLVLLLSGCDHKAQPLDEENMTAPQEQYEQGKIETHSTE